MVDRSTGLKFVLLGRQVDRFELKDIKTRKVNKQFILSSRYVLYYSVATQLHGLIKNDFLK